MSDASADQLTLERLLAAPELHVGHRVVAAGRLLSYSWSEFWLIPGKDAIAARRGVRLVHPDLDILLVENVPSLGGSYAFYHPSVVAGVVGLDPSRSPAVELGQLSALVVTIGGRTYPLIGSATVVEPTAAPEPIV